jgi:hypothetical protein
MEARRKAPSATKVKALTRTRETTEVAATTRVVMELIHTEARVATRAGKTKAMAINRIMAARVARIMEAMVTSKVMEASMARATKAIAGAARDMVRETMARELTAASRVKANMDTTMARDHTVTSKVMVTRIQEASNVEPDKATRVN